MKIKTLLFFVHRWLGIGMCLLFVLWFASGIIMMYVEYPELTEQERFANLPLLDTAQVLISPSTASAAVGMGYEFSSVKLTTVLQRPAYQFQDIDGRISIIFADDGTQLERLTTEAALVAARQSQRVDGNADAVYDEQVGLDQWSISTGLNRHRPLHRVLMNDAEGSVVYVSSATAQVVLDTNTHERFWNWLGSTVHWIYPVQLRKNASLWTQVIIYLSLVGIVSVVTGGIIGFMRIRVRNRYRGSSLSPYLGWMKWHHILGLVTLAFVSTFIFSGLMSMGPWGIFDSSTSAQTQINRYTGGAIVDLSDLPTPDFGSLGEPVKEIQWYRIQDTSYYVLKKSHLDSEPRFSRSALQDPSNQLTTAINNAIPALLPQAEVQSLEIIATPDNYYYARRSNFRPFPVLRVKFDDRESTWYHIDLTTGEIVNRLTQASRRERWLFNGLHSLDFQILLLHRPLWDLLMIALSVIGLGFSITAVVIGWRRLLN